MKTTILLVACAYSGVLAYLLQTSGGLSYCLAGIPAYLAIGIASAEIGELFVRET